MSLKRSDVPVMANKPIIAAKRTSCVKIVIGEKLITFNKSESAAGP